MITREDALVRYPDAAFFAFGDGAELNGEILALVRSGKKTISCDAVAGFAARSEPLPLVGKIDVATDWDGTPQLAIRTVEVLQIPFDQMSAQMIPAQGEFRDLAHWRAGYQAYLTRAGLFTSDVLMLVERFELVEDFLDLRATS
ncbi:MAG: ASCH domain-containing protein, partial [Sulfitobacter sp.]